MNYGRFFDFDFESSYLQKGVTVFNYKWLQQKPQGKRKSPRYPIYLVFTPEALLFNLHYYDFELQDENWKSASHYHNTIIELRLSPNTDMADGLSESLNNAFNAQFPMKANKPLRDMIRDSFASHDYEMSGFAQMQPFKTEYIEVFAGVGETHFLRKIILDFLYDFEFTDVFKNVAFYDAISVKLRENFLFTALLNKLRYYYYRTVICADELANCGIEDAGDWDKNFKFFFEQYANAEHAWVTTIMDEKAMKVFHESPWFEDTCQELDQVYATSRSKSWKNDRDNVAVVPTIPSVSPVPSSLPGDLKSKKNYLKRIGVTESDSFVLTVSNLLNLIRVNPVHHTSPKSKETSPFEKAIAKHCETAKVTAWWEVSHYHFTGLAKLWFGDTKTMLWSTLLVGIVVVPMFILFIWLYGKTDDGTKAWLFLIIPVLTGAVLLAMSDVMRRHFRSLWGMGGTALLMPRLLAAIVTAWFTMTMSEDLFKYFALTPSEKFNYQWPAIVIMALITMLFIAFEAKSLNPYDKKYHYLVSAVIVFGIAYVYSLIVGLMVFDFFGDTMLTELENEAKTPHKHKTEFIIQFSFFASFIGIFLQLMFQGKSVTETK